eukprot:8544424-Pyramimonas_sp.AAC.1
MVCAFLSAGILEGHYSPCAPAPVCVLYCVGWYLSGSDNLSQHAPLSFCGRFPNEGGDNSTPCHVVRCGVVGDQRSHLLDILQESDGAVSSFRRELRAEAGPAFLDGPVIWPLRSVAQLPAGGVVP